MRVVALFRVSTERQANEGTSLDSQERTYREQAAREGWTTVDEFKGCESATQAATERQVLQKALACIREHKPDAIWVIEQSRLTRGDRLEVATLMRELTENGVKIVVNGAVRDPSSIDEEMVLTIQSAVDHAESRRIKSRMQRGKRQRALEGKKTSGPAPYGYMNPPPGHPGRGTLQVVSDEAVVVRRIFEMAAEGLGEHAIVRALNQRAIPAPRGGNWGKSTVRRVLNCPAYIGTAASGVWVDRDKNRNFRQDLANPNAIVREGAHEAIIDKETWAAAHGRAKQVRTAYPRLLSGLLYIDGAKSECDASHGSAWYRPPRGVKGMAWLDTNATDARVWERFVSLATGEEFVASLMRQVQNPHERAVTEQEIGYLEEQIAKLTRRLANYQDMRADDEMSKQDFRSKTQAARDAISAHQTEMGALRAKLSSMDGSYAGRIVGAVRMLLAGQRVLTVEQQRAILRSIVRRVDVESVATNTMFKRDARGRVLSGRSQRWKVAKVSLTLALLPTGGQPCDEAPREPGTKDLRHRQLDTTLSCWARQEPERR